MTAGGRCWGRERDRSCPTIGSHSVHMHVRNGDVHKEEAARTRGDDDCVPSDTAQRNMSQFQATCMDFRQWGSIQETARARPSRSPVTVPSRSARIEIALLAMTDSHMPSHPPLVFHVVPSADHALVGDDTSRHPDT